MSMSCMGNDRRIVKSYKAIQGWDVMSLAGHVSMEL